MDAQKHTGSYALMAVSALAYFALAYATPRTDFTQLLALFAVAFAGYLFVFNQRFPLWHGIAAAIFFRMIFLLATPALSDDYFRFVWDGNLLAGGYNPYLYLPAYFVAPDGPSVTHNTTELFRQLNSQSYYSIYPPVTQAVFWLAAKLSAGDVLGAVVVMRVVVLLAEVANILLLLRLLRKMGLPDKNVLLYALNPLVILELTGNLHFEALMVTFLLLGLQQLFYHRHLVAGIAMGLSIGTKLLPLMFLPFVLRKIGWKQFLLFGSAVLFTVAGLYYPLLSLEVIQNIFQSLDLYFQKFEFNASVYYLVRWFGYRLAGYNIIMVLGPLLSLATLSVILALASVKRLGSIRRLAGYMAASLTVYLLLANTVHPWYITPLLALTVLSQFRFAVAWSGLAILSYAAYRHSTYSEDMLLVGLEYLLVILWLAVELYLYRQRKRPANLVQE